MSQYQTRSVKKNYARKTLSLRADTVKKLDALASAKDFSFSKLCDKILSAYCAKLSPVKE